MFQKHLVSEHWRNTLRKGDLGESFVQWYCQMYNLTYKRAEIEDNLQFGIDCFIENVSSDVKNTPRIYMGNFVRRINKFYVRHPFKPESKCEQYVILNLDEEKRNFNISYLGPIEEYLVSKYFKDKLCLEEAKSILNSFNDKSTQQAKMTSGDQFLYKIKMELSPLIKDTVKCDYQDESECIRKSSDEQSLSLISYEDRK